MFNRLTWLVGMAAVLSMLPATAATAAVDQAHSPRGWMLRVDSATGDFTVSASDPAWAVGGSVGAALSDLSSTKGRDGIGPFLQIGFGWQADGRRSGSIRIYDNRPVALFSVKYEDAVKGSPPPFPVLTRLPAKLMAFRYGETDHLRPELFHLAGSESGEQYGGPFALFDRQANAMIVSPASHFMIAMMSGDLQHGIRSGLNASLEGVPAGFEQKTLLAMGPGINSTWDSWGNALGDLYGRQRPANDADIGLKYLGFWTDNGSYYYYNYDHDKGYAGTLLDVRDYLQRQGIPIHYMQLDSWWYPKTFDSFQKKEANKPRSKDPRLPAGSWNRYGGLLEFTAARELFPKGLGDFQQQLNLPLIVHNRWIDPQSPYHASYKISGVAAVDPAWWNKIISDVAGWGVTTYEQDWNNWIYLKSPQLSDTTWAGDAYMDGMAAAAAAHDVTMQYCMVMPRFLMQGGAKYPNLTTVRVSGDRLERKKWREFLYGSTMAGALGVWPWTDVYRSDETPNILISTLSAGMVGISDQIGKENAANIFRAVRKDGVIVKPDAPLMPTDFSFIAEAQADAEERGAPATPLALVCATHSGTGAESAWYVFACTKDPAAPHPAAWEFDPASVGLAGPAVAYDYFAGAAQRIDPGDGLRGTLNREHDWTYRVVVPIGPSGMALIGDVDQFVTRGRQRIAEVKDADAQTLQAAVQLAAGETAVALTVYAPAAPRASVTGGATAAVSYDPGSKLARVRVTRENAAAAQTVVVSVRLR